MTKIYLIRHGQSEWNKLFKIQGQQDTKLTALGKEQAKKLGDRLIGEDIDIIYTSDLERAYNTGKIISEIIDRPMLSCEGLREIKFGPWEGLCIKEIKDLYSEEYDTWLSEPHKLNMEGAENLQELRKRAMDCVNKIIDENPGQSIAIVTHGAFLKSLILGLLDIDDLYYKNFTLSNVSLSIIEFRDFNNVLTLLNDVSHLKEL